VELVNEEVDKMLNFYMTRLNEKIDDSYDDSDDDEINLKNFPKLNEFMNINNNYLSESKVSKEKTNLQNDANNSKGKNTNSTYAFDIERNSNHKQKSNYYNYNNSLKEEKSNYKDSTLHLEEDLNSKIFKKNIEENIYNYGDNILEENFDNIYSNGNRNGNEISKQKKDEMYINHKNEISKISKKSEIQLKTENTNSNNDNDNFNDNYNDTFSKESEKIETQQNISQINIDEYIENSINFDKNNLNKIPPNNNNRPQSTKTIKSEKSTKSEKSQKSVKSSKSVKSENSEKSIKSKKTEKTFNSEKSEKIIKEEITKNEDKEKNENNENIQNRESLDLDHIRLNRSCEEIYVRQNMEQFDIEYMCRCLGMALMKHLESSKEKMHVTELVDSKQKFSFFNSIYNKNINFLMTFFNLETKIQEMSNLDKIDYFEKLEKEKNLNENINSKGQENFFEKDEKFKFQASISYLTHIKDTKNIDEYKSKGKFNSEDDNVITGMNEYDKDFSYNNKVKKDDLEKELSTIHEFFKNSAKSNKYKNMSEATKNIMTEDLKSIHEVDSVEYCKINRLYTGEMNDKKDNNNDYINLLRESVNNLFSNTDNENIDDINNNYNEFDTLPENLEEIEEKGSENADDDNQFDNVNSNYDVNINDQDDINKNLYELNFDGDENYEDEEFNENINENPELELKDRNNNIVSNINEINTIKETTNNKFSNYNLNENGNSKENYNELMKNKNLSSRDYSINNNKNNNNLNENLEDKMIMPETPHHLKDNINDDYEDEINENELNELEEDIKENPEIFESGNYESNYIIDISNAEKLKYFILKTSEVYDDDYDYPTAKILNKKFVQIPDPQAIFEFCANVMILTKMEKEVIIISLIYMERFIFNTGVLINSRNWKRILFTSLIIASKIWDDDSFENNHFAQVFTHLKIGEINLLERTFLELINYKVYVKCSEYFKYFFIIKSIALKYNFNGFNLVPISVERMMKVQEFAFLAQKKYKKKYCYNNSAEF
jgi:hypothetical protein